MIKRSSVIATVSFEKHKILWKSRPSQAATDRYLVASLADRFLKVLIRPILLPLANVEDRRDERAKLVRRRHASYRQVLRHSAQSEKKKQ
jgi:hypothetical protein